MTSPHQPSKGRARVMWADSPAQPAYCQHVSNKTCRHPGVFIPCPSLKSARARKNWESLTSEQNVERIAKAISLAERHPWGAYTGSFRLMQLARAVLAVTEGRG